MTEQKLFLDERFDIEPVRFFVCIQLLRSVNSVRAAFEDPRAHVTARWPSGRLTNVR